MAKPRFHQSLQQTTRQEMRLLPRMLQSIEVLQLSLGELDRFLESAVLENEALQLEPAPGPGPGGGGAAAGAATERHAAWLEGQPDRGPGLGEHLAEQLRLLDLDPDLRRWVQLVIDGVDGRGYLSVDDGTLLALARELGLEGDASWLGRAVAVVQGLEPRGVGGRDAVEALLLQLDPSEPDYPLLCRLLEEHLDDLARNKLPVVARGLGIGLEELRRLTARLRELDPAPGRALEDGTSPPLLPDVVVEPKPVPGSTETTFSVRVDRSGLPPVSLDPEVGRLASDPEQTPSVRSYLRGKVDRARWILEAIEQRERTLLRVATWLFERQLAFLRDGPGHVVPLTMTEAAEDLDLHLSTVSRAVAGKYAATPWGVVSLRSLFPAPAGGQAGVARGGLQDALRAVVEGEDPARPLSDDEIVEALGAAGFRVARRTVAKHRTELGIPSSYRRRRY